MNVNITLFLIICSFTSPHTAVPVLLPYKPRGSEELFYVPQTEADSSSTDTTIESTHSGTVYSYLIFLSLLVNYNQCTFLNLWQYTETSAGATARQAVNYTL